MKYCKNIEIFTNFSNYNLKKKENRKNNLNEIYGYIHVDLDFINKFKL